MQLTENDKTTEIPDELPSDFLVPEDAYDKATSGQQHGLHQPPPDPLVEQIQSILKQAHVPEGTLKSVQAALQKELDELKR